jgi:Branched-chain amino acid transport protein (AzlD).
MIADTLVWATIGIIAVGTFAIRGSFIALFSLIDAVPRRVELLLGFVPAAVLAALAVPSIVVADGTLVALSEPRLIAGAIAGGTAVITDNMFTVIAVGMGVLWIVTAVG